MSKSRGFGVLVVVGVVGWGAVGRADDWPAPEPVSFHGGGGEYVAEIFPPRSRQNDSDRPLGVFYRMEYGGARWGVSGRVVWKRPLVNREMPYEAIVSADGRLVTLDDYGNLGEKDAVVVYRADGSVVRSLALQDIVPAADLGNAERSRSSTYWRRQARYFFVGQPTRLYIALAWGTAVEIGLDDGLARYDKASAFPTLVPFLARGGNQEVEIWRTSLRFSSITDAQALAAGAAPPAPTGSNAPPPPPSPTTTTTAPSGEPPRAGSCAGCAVTPARAPRLPLALAGFVVALTVGRRRGGRPAQGRRRRGSPGSRSEGRGKPAPRTPTTPTA